MTDYRTRLDDVAADLVRYEEHCTLARAYGGPTMLPRHPVDERRVRQMVADLRQLLSEADAWGFLAAHPALSVEAVEPDVEGDPLHWAVYRESGGRSDREFTQISQAATPLAAVRIARQALGDDQPPPQPDRGKR